MKKQLMAWVLTGTLAGTLGSTMTTITALAQVEELTMTDELTDSGLVRTTGDDLIVAGVQQDEASDEPLVGDEALPEVYRTALVTDISSQGQRRLCWAYSALDVGQILQLKQGVTTETAPLYSPGHLAYSAFSGEGDHFASNRPWYEVGGNSAAAYGTLLSWYGAASNAAYPTTNQLTVSEEEKKESLSHLIGFERLPYQFKNAENKNPLSDAWRDGVLDVKRQVRDNGAVAIDYAYSSAGLHPELGNGVIYHEAETTENHEGVIVGWDDTKETGAALTGAFLVKNTWGEASGDNGYHWISYYDQSMTNPVIYRFEGTTDGAHQDDVLFSYDATAYWKIVRDQNLRRGANVFTAEHTTIVDAVGLYLPKDGDYTVQLETNLQNGMPGTGKIAAEVSGSRDNMGFYTIEIPETVIKNGEQFAVIATIKSRTDGMYHVFFEGASTSKIFRRETVSNEGESFVFGKEGTAEWQDTFGMLAQDDTPYRNVCLKAYGNESAGEDEEVVTMYRLYNPNSGEHFYTARAGERDMLVRLGWNDEGTGWTAPKTSAHPVYRLYNPNAGDHHYTMSAAEQRMLVKVGWKDEGIGWYSDDKERTPLYREYNPNQKAWNHNYTTKLGEHQYLVRIGWRDEGIGWYGVRE